MKKMRMLLALFLCMLCLSGCGGGDVSEVARNLGKCERYTPRQIDAAMDVVEDFFGKNYDGCKLLRLEYDEDDTAREAIAWAEEYAVADAIVLVSDFYVADSGASPSLEPDSVYENWEWILVKTAFGWELKNWGYG